MNLIDYIVLTEFDINSGSVVRVQFPSTIPDTDPCQIADNMIPEGSHNFGVLSSYFTLGRKPIKDLQSDQSKLFSNSLLLLQKLLPPEIISKLTSCVTDNSKQEAKLFKIKNLEWLPFYEVDPKT